MDHEHDTLKESTPSIYKELRRQDAYHEENSIRDTECPHKYWIQRCSLCRAIMASDCQVNLQPGDYQKKAYSEFDTLVCTYTLAMQLQAASVVQVSKLYWVEHKESGILTLRCRGNVTLKGTRVAAAFTSSELCKRILRLPKNLLTAKVFQYLGQNAHDPNRMARFLLKTLKEV